MKKRMISVCFAAAVLGITGCGSKKPDAAATGAVITEPEMTVSAETVSAEIATEAAGSVQAEAVTFTDSMGNTIVTGKPENAAILFSSFADIWKLAGGETAITVGEAVERGFASADAVLVDEGTGKQINLEALIAAKPDFVICTADYAAQAEATSFLLESGIPCASFRVECFSDYLSMLKICTEITGNQENYATYGSEVEKRVKEVLDKIPSDGPAPEILFIRAGSGESSVKAKIPSDHFAAAMLQELGTHNIAEDAPVLLDGLSTEEILMRDPEYIFIATMGKEEAARAYMDEVIAGEAWQSLSAVKNGHYYYLPKDLFQYKPNARWDEAYRYLAQLLFPEVDFS